MSGVLSGSEISGSTMEWWMKQDLEIFKRVFLGAVTNGKDIRETLILFSDYVSTIKKKYDVKTVYLWGNGSKADNVWLETSFRLNNLPWPFHYREDMDLRTLMRLGKELGVDAKDQVPQNLNKHVALDDVLYQVALASTTFVQLQQLIVSKEVKKAS